MNKDFRLALLRDWQAGSPEQLIDFTRYDLPAREPDDPKKGGHSRNWSLMNRLNQKERAFAMARRSLHEDPSDMGVRMWIEKLSGETGSLGELAAAYVEEAESAEPQLALQFPLMNRQDQLPATQALHPGDNSPL